MIYKWASNHYVEHLLKKKENAGMAAISYQEDDLYAASNSYSAKNTYSFGGGLGPSSTKKKTGYKETGVKIRIGGPEEKEGDKDKKDGEEKADGDKPQDNKEEEKPAKDEDFEECDYDM